MFTRILCPIDFDHNSLSAVRMAGRMAQREQAKLYLLHVVPRTDPMVISAPFISQRTEKRAGEELRNIAQHELAGVEHELLVRFGHPAAEILAAEADVDADLVVMATHGRGGVAHMLLGSVAEKVVRESSCPVLVVRMKPAHRAAVAEPKRPAA